MNVDWKTIKLGSLIDTQKGYAFKSKWYSDTGRPIVKVSDFTEDSVDINNLTFIPEEIAMKYLKYELNTDDVLVQTVGSWPTNPSSVVGKVIRILDQANHSLLNQNAVKIIPNESIDKKFLFYLLRNDQFKNYIVGTAQGSASQASITLESLRAYEFLLPSLLIQKKIASILSTIDDAIENNNRRILILEEMAQRIYREWFVYFRYPGHESDKLVESKLGIIPEGWEVKKLREFILNVRQSERAGDHLLSIPYVPIDCIPRKSLFLSSAKPGSEAKSSLISFQKYDILFGAMRSYFHKVVISPFNGTTRTTCFVLRPIDPGYYAFTMLTLFQESTIDFANSHSRGSTMPYAVWDDGLAEMPAIYPSKEVALDFNKIVEPMLKRIALGFFEQKNLRQTRDFLLPMLISGKIDVSELDIDIGETDESL